MDELIELIILIMITIIIGKFQWKLLSREHYVKEISVDEIC
jgi:hypothetical protein